jgi:hypothetical protein
MLITVRSAKSNLLGLELLIAINNKRLLDWMGVITVPKKIDDI